MQVSASDRCERIIVFTLFILAKDQIDEEFLLCNVESWESLSSADTSGLVLGRALVADFSLWRFPGILLLPEIRLPVPVPSKNEQSIEQLLS